MCWLFVHLLTRLSELAISSEYPSLIENVIGFVSKIGHYVLQSLKLYAFSLVLVIAKFFHVFQIGVQDLARRLDERSVLGLFAATMER